MRNASASTNSRLKPAALRMTRRRAIARPCPIKAIVYLSERRNGTQRAIVKKPPGKKYLYRKPCYDIAERTEIAAGKTDLAPNQNEDRQGSMHLHLSLDYALFTLKKFLLAFSSNKPPTLTFSARATRISV